MPVPAAPDGSFATPLNDCIGRRVRPAQPVERFVHTRHLILAVRISTEPSPMGVARSSAVASLGSGPRRRGEVS